MNRARQGDQAALARSAEWMRLHQEVILQTLVGLRGVLLQMRLGRPDAVTATPREWLQQGETNPFTRTEDVVVHLRRQAHSLDAATRELVSPRG